MEQSKQILSAIAVVLTFLGYMPYITSIIKKHTTPHIYSWGIWSLDAFIIFALQITHGAGSGAFVAFAAGLLSVTVLTLTLVNHAKQDITTADIVFSSLALTALVLWIFAKQPLLSSVLIMTVDVFGFIPTVRKSWHKPHSENLSFYMINTVRFGFALAALQEYSVITVLYPGIWLVGNALFSFMLVARRKLQD